ncbi:MAG: pentapeptide repeat-containing protein [Gemmatimonadales bacterium]
MDLSEVYFLRTDLRGRNLTRARLKGSAFAATQLRGATFNHADCESAAFWAVDLSDVSFRHANLRGVDFGAETLEISDVVSFFPELPQVDERQLPPVRFRGVDLRHSELAGTCLRGLSLAGADLRGATGLVLDDNDIHEARLEGSDAEWPRLMSTYAGSRFAVHLLLLLAFLLPLILKVSFGAPSGRLGFGVGDVASGARAIGCCRGVAELSGW